MLGSRWAAPDGDNAAETHILVTHYHWDHIQGIPFFAPLYVENNHFPLLQLPLEISGARQPEAGV